MLVKLNANIVSEIMKALNNKIKSFNKFKKTTTNSTS